MTGVGEQYSAQGGLRSLGRDDSLAPGTPCGVSVRFTWVDPVTRSLLVQRRASQQARSIPDWPAPGTHITLLALVSRTMSCGRCRATVRIWAGEAGAGVETHLLKCATNGSWSRGTLREVSRAWLPRATLAPALPSVLRGCSRCTRLL